VNELHIQVSGRVQGVGFRWFAREKARRWGLRGWVRNLADGSVEIAAEGPDENLRGFVDHLRLGPPGAYVEDIGDLPPTGSATQDPFTILR
jgi:acylphosphatase